MTLGAAIFASVVLVLLVYNKPFRNASAWVAAVTTSLALVGALGWYGYTKYQDDAQAKQAAAHKVDQNPDVTPTEHGPWEDFYPEPGQTVEIHGGETLKIVEAVESKGTLGKFKLIRPIIFLGHGQEFALACGNSGEQKVPREFPTVRVQRWDEHGNPIVSELLCK